MGFGSTVMQVDIVDGTFVIDAALIGEVLGIAAADVPALMRSRAITSVCEVGIDTDQGTFRLNFFHRARHARLRIDATGRILKRSTIDFGKESVRRTRRGPEKVSLRRRADTAA